MIQSQIEFEQRWRRMTEIDKLLSSLRAEREKTATRLKALDRAISSLETAKAALPPEVLEVSTDLSLLPQNSAKEPQRVRGLLSPLEIATEARAAILAAGKPLKRGQLVRELEKRGVPLAGKDKNKNLGTILWRQGGMFVSLTRLGYWPRDTPLPGIYVPDLDH